MAEERKPDLMAHGHGGKKSTTIDDKIKEIVGDTLEESFSKYQSMTKEEDLNKILVQTFHPAFDDFYSTLKSGLEKISEGGKLPSKKKKEVREVTVKALEKFFEKASPQVLEAAKGIKDSEERYQMLVKQFNTYTGVGPNKPGIGHIIEASIGNEPYKNVDKLLLHLKEYSSQRAAGLKEYLQGKASSVTLGKHHSLNVAKHLKEKVLPKDVEVANEALFLSQDHDELYSLLRGLSTGRFPEGQGYESFHLHYKGGKKEEKKAGHGHGHH